MEEKHATAHVEHSLAAAAAASSDADVVGLNQDILQRMSERLPNLSELIEGARRSSAAEHAMTTWDAFKLYPKAIAFSVTMSMAIVMEGYDTALLGSFFGYPTFQERFGVRQPNGSYQLSAPWQSGLQNGVQVGEILGLMFAGWVADRIGYRKTILAALVMMIGTIFILFFAQNIGMLFAGEVLCGLPWGAFQTLTTTYAAEVSPIVLRPYLTTYVNLCWVTGQFIAIGVLRGLLGRSDQWAWRIPYAIQWIWPVPIIIGVLLAPESPWWLVRKGRLEEAKRALTRLVSKQHLKHDLDDTLAFMVVTNEHEKIVNSGVSYWDCFKGVDLRRTEIVSVVWIIQVTCGMSFGSNVVYFMEQVGMTKTQAFDFGVGDNALGWIGTVCSWFVMQHVGRRKLYISGLAVMFLILITVGFMGIPAAGNSGIGYASGALLCIFVFTYDLTVGPVCYCLVSELSSTRLRIKSVVLARNFYNIAGIAGNFLQAPILNPSAWNLRGKGGFIWAVLCGASLVWSYFRLPEPKGRTPAELDVLFEQKVPARDFKSTKVDPFGTHGFSSDTETSVEGSKL